MNRIDNYKIPNMDKFNTSPKKSIFQICENIMVFLLFYPVISNALETIYKNNFVFVQGVSLIIYIVAINLIRIKVKNHILAIVLILTLCCIFLLIPFKSYERILYGIYAVLALITCIKKFYKIKFNFYDLSFFSLGEILLLTNLLVAYTLKNPLSKYLTLFSAVIFLLIFLFYFNRSRYKLFITSEKNCNLNSMVNLSSRKFITILFCTFLFFMCFILLITKDINSNINYSLIHKVTILFSTKNFHDPNLNARKILIKKMQKKNLIKNNMIKSNNTSYNDNKYIYIMLCLALTALILFIAFKVVKFLINNKVKNQIDTETEITFLEEDFKKDLQHIVPKFNFNLSNKEKLRKYYKKLIKHYRKKGLGVKTSSTPSELKDGILNLTGDDIESITKIYNKSRYSLYEPTKEDIATIKKNAKE